jgi:hypothetical protein
MTVPGPPFWTPTSPPDCWRGPAGLWLGAGARLCGGALHRHPDLHVLGRVLLARPGQLLVRTAEEAQELSPSARSGAPRGRCSNQVQNKETPWNFSRSAGHPVHEARVGLQRDFVPDFAAAVFFLFTRGLHLSVEFTGGTVMEVATRSPLSWKRCAAPWQGWATPTCRCRTLARRVT